MKNLLILISLLLLSSPVIVNSHKGETLYRWGESCNYKWMELGDKQTHSVYQGQLKDGKPDGLCVIFDPNGSKYVGSWKNGIWNGKGKYSFNDGFGYEGEWKNGVENGMGTLNYPNGDKYEGEFKNGKMYKKNGDKYIQKNGEWILRWGVMYFGLRNGELGYYKGKWDEIESEDNKDYSIYEGEIEDGKPNGEGIETSSNEGKYVGEFQNGKWINGEYFNKDGKIGVKYVNGEMIKQ